MQFLTPASAADLMRPTESSDSSPFYVEAKIEYPYTKNTNGKEVPSVLRIFFSFDAGIENVDEEPNFPPVITKFNPADITFTQLADRQQAIQAQINLCINAGEHINNTLRTVNVNILTEWASVSGELLEQYNELMLQDFMGQKERFTNYIKKRDDYKNVMTKEQRRDLDKFVLNRNIYTHEILMAKVAVTDFVQHNGLPILRPWAHQYTFVIEYISKKTHGHEKAIVNEQIMNDYLEFAQIMDNILKTFSDRFQASFNEKKARKGRES